MYDYVIVGAGPAGLTAALLLSRAHTVALVDSGEDIGGCHRSMWADSPHGLLYYEHGPKVYSSQYRTLREMMAEINARLGSECLVFDRIFTKYSGLAKVIGRIRGQFTLTDVAKFAAATVTSPSNMSVSEAFSSLSPAARVAVDKICRLSDGAPANRTRMDKFTSLIRIVETLYLPVQPLAETLFYYWKLALVQSGVHISLSTRVIGCTSAANSSHHLHTSEGDFRARKVIFAVPPQSLEKILPNTFTAEYLATHSYTKYYCVALHWVGRKRGFGDFPETKWGIVTAELGAGFAPQTAALQCAVSITDVPGEGGKPASACSAREIVDEIVLQLGLPPPSYAAFAGDFPAYVDGLVNVSVPYEVRAGVYTIGTHNLTSKMPFTTFESAAESAKIFVAVVAQKS